MSTYVDTDTETWTINGTDHCDTPGCWNTPVIIAADGWHQKFCNLHLSAAVDVALHFPAFSGWYRIEHISTSANGHATAVVHPL